MVRKRTIPVLIALVFGGGMALGAATTATAETSLSAPVGAWDPQPYPPKPDKHAQHIFHEHDDKDDDHHDNDKKDQIIQGQKFLHAEEATNHGAGGHHGHHSRHHGHHSRHHGLHDDSGDHGFDGDGFGGDDSGGDDSGAHATSGDKSGGGHYGGGHYGGKPGHQYYAGRALPFTGAPVATVAGVGGGLLVAGAFATLISVRRRRSSNAG